MRAALLILALLAGLILRSTSKEVLCFSHQSQNETRYFVPETTATGCHHSWTNSTDHVFATNDEKMNELVASSNITTLVTHSCHREIKYTRSCLSEREKRVGTCIINCTTLDHQTASGPVVEPPQWMVYLSVFIVLLLIAGILCFFFKDKLFRRRGPSYSPTPGNNMDEV